MTEEKPGLPVAGFEDIARLARLICDAPAACLMLPGQGLVGDAELPEGVADILPREAELAPDGITEIEDLSALSRLAGHPLVTGPAAWRSCVSARAQS
jgi:hypothetical protein